MFKPKIKKDLSKAFLHERHINLEKLNSLIKQDIFLVFSSYFDIKPNDLILRIEFNNLGEYELKCKVSSKRIKVVGFIK